MELYSAYSNEAARYKFDFVINPNLPPDCVELWPESQPPPEGGFYKSDPVFRPKNVPDNFILVKVTDREISPATFIWTRTLSRDFTAANKASR